MKDMGIIHGSAAQAVPLVVGLTTVYVHDDIRKISDDPEMYEYHEVQYTIAEYIAMLAQRQKEFEKNQALTDFEFDYRMTCLELGIERE